MTADDTGDDRRAWMRQRLTEVDAALGEALVAHSLSDDESADALLDIELGHRQRQLDQLAQADPVGLVWFGDDDRWIDKRLGGHDA